MGNPYVYRIDNVKGEFYFGVRWNYDGEPQDDLWFNYFTSSTLIKEMILQNGSNYFTAKIIKILSTKEEALNEEYNLIKNNIDDKKCLNRALGKCAIWDDVLKKQVSESMKKFYSIPENREKLKFRSLADKNPNFRKKSWRNVNSDIDSWKKAILIYEDYISEKWDLNKYGFGREYLMNRYKIVQGTSRCLIKLLKNNWNPLLDSDYLLFLSDNTRMS